MIELVLSNLSRLTRQDKLTVPIPYGTTWTGWIICLLAGSRVRQCLFGTKE